MQTCFRGSHLPPVARHCFSFRSLAHTNGAGVGVGTGVGVGGMRTISTSSRSTGRSNESLGA